MKRLALPAVLAVLLHLALLLIEMPPCGTPQSAERSTSSLRMQLVASAGPEKSAHRPALEKPAHNRPPTPRPAPAPVPSAKVAAPPMATPPPPPSRPSSSEPPPPKAPPAKKRTHPQAHPSPAVAAKPPSPRPRIKTPDAHVTAASTDGTKSRDAAAPVTARAAEDGQAATPSPPEAAAGDTGAASPVATTASLGPAHKALPDRRAQPLYRLCPPPKYPRRARQRAYQGVVSLTVLVDAEGRVKDLKVARSSGYKSLDRAAVRAVRKWIFEPGIENDRRVDMWVEVPIRFSLK